MSRAAPPSHPSRVILASAGTGKTYRLTSQFLALMAGDGHVAPESILATTFTRKAAGEIFDRLARRLLAACEPGEKGDKALADLRKSVDLAIDAPACVHMLARLAASLHRLHIRTIDSFFAQAAMAYALELDLPSGWHIVESDEDERLRTEAIDRVLEEGDRDELVDLIRVLHGGEFSRSVHDAILRAVSRAYPVYLQSITNPQAWEVAAPQRPPLTGAPLDAAIASLAQLELPKTGTGRVHKTWEKKHAQAIECAKGDEWDGFLDTGIADRVMRAESAYCRIEITPEVVRAYQPLIDHAASVALDNLDRRNRATRRLMADFDREYLRLKRTNGAYRFDDVPRLLLQRRAEAGGAGLDELYYRLDGRIAHVLLDEFQDTSIIQFDLLRPMLDEMLADPSAGRSVFCVGDVKQSLYAWRDAEPELLRRLPSLWPQFGEAETLEHSFRSSPVILDALNETFTGLAENPAVQPAKAGEDWAGRFRTHEPAEPLRDLPGEAALLVGPEVLGDSFERRRAVLEYAAARVRTIRSRAPSASVGVLVRKRKHIPLLVNALRGLRIDASEEGGNPVTDDPGVAVATSLLWLADHPGDSVAAFHVATSPIGVAVGLTHPCDTFAIERLAAALRRRLSRDGYASLLSAILADVAPSLDERGFARFCQLIDLAQRFDEQAGTRPAEFVRFVQARGVEEPGRRPVRVMTIHGAKGLEFDAVVLPELQDRWQLRPGDMFVDREDPLGPIAGVSLYAKESLRAMSPRLERMHNQCLAREVEEELCVLYVAMSRAVHHLEMIIEPSEKPDTHPSAANVLRHALAPGVPADGGATLWSRRSEQEWPAHVAEHKRAEAPLPRERVELVLRRPERARAARLQRRSPSSLEGGQRLDLADALRLSGTGAALERGTLIHAWFETIEWLDPAAPPSDESLLEIARGLAIEEATARALLPSFAAALASDSARAVLSLERYAPRLESGQSLEVRREHPFAARDLDEDAVPWLLTGRFDRLVIARDNATPTWAEIIDFKTDDIPPDAQRERDERVEFYRPQIESYRRAAASILRLPPDRITATLLFTSCDAAIEVEG